MALLAPLHALSWRSAVELALAVTSAIAGPPGVTLVGDLSTWVAHALAIYWISRATLNTFIVFDALLVSVPEILFYVRQGTLYFSWLIYR